MRDKHQKRVGCGHGKQAIVNELTAEGCLELGQRGFEQPTITQSVRTAISGNDHFLDLAEHVDEEPRAWGMIPGCPGNSTCRAE